MQSIEEHPLLKKLKYRRMFIGFVSTSFSFAVMYGLLSVQFVVDLGDASGGRWVFEPWIGTGGWWAICAGIAVLLAGLYNNINHEKNDSVHQIIPPQQESITWLSNEESIRTMVKELAEQMDVQVDRCYVFDEHMPNAFASLSLSKGNLLILHRNLIEILDEESLKSVIAHELAHMAGQDVLHRMFNILPRVIMRWMVLLKGIQLFGVLLLAQSMGELFMRFVGFGLFLLVLGLIYGFVERFEHRYSQIKENIADVYGAHFASVEGSINAFLFLNSRMHTLSAFGQILKQYTPTLNQSVLNHAVSQLPRGSMDVAKMSAMVPRWYAQAHLDCMIKELQLKMTEEEKKTLLASLLDKLFAYDFNEEIELEIEEPFAWKEFDWNQDGELQAPEIVAMLDSLRKDPKALTSEEGSSTHPATRDRILLLAEVFATDLMNKEGA